MVAVRTAGADVAALALAAGDAAASAAMTAADAASGFRKDMHLLLPDSRGRRPSIVHRVLFPQRGPVGDDAVEAAAPRARRLLSRGTVLCW
jgi:hypothetical protein